VKITYDQALASPVEEILDIKIVWNPKDDAHEGYVAMIHSVIDTVRQLTILQKTLEEIDSHGEENEHGEEND
jgi:hypothetical protein